MARELKRGQQCEHESTALVNGVITTVGCQVRHHDRQPGEPPKQLVPVKDKKAIRFMCTVHAPMHTKTVRQLPRKRAAGSPAFFGEQEKLL